MAPEPLPQRTFRAIAVDRARKDTFGNDKTEPGNTEGVRFEHHTEPGTFDGSPAGKQRGDISRAESLPATVALATAQTLKRARPLARRARSTARPPRVRMRTRNPWVRFLRMTEG